MRRRNIAFRERMVQFMMLVELLITPLPPEVTARVEARSRDSRQRYLDRLEYSARRENPRIDIGCGNLAHVTAGCPAAEKKAVADSSRAHVAIVTGFLARIIDDIGHDIAVGGSAWAQAVWVGALPGVQFPAQWPSPDGGELVQGWNGLTSLSAMQRPVLLRCWGEAAIRLSPEGRLNDAQSDALRLAALLLDCPCPKVLADQYIEVE